MPRYPYGKLEVCQEAVVLLNTIVGEDGLPRRPVLLSFGDPMLALAAMDALREWRFEPALLHGEPVKVFFNQEVNFVVQGCRRSAGGR